MKIAEPKFWWNNQNSSFIKFFIWKWNLFLSFIIFLKNFFIRQYLPSIPVICIGNFVVGGQGKTPFVRFLRKKLELNDIKTCVISKGYGGSSRLTKVIDAKDSSGDFGDEAVLHSTDGLTIVSKDRKRSFELLKQSPVDITHVLTLFNSCFFLKNLTKGVFPWPPTTKLPIQITGIEGRYCLIKKFFKNIIKLRNKFHFQIKNLIRLEF
jgi:hypothetical protein